MDSIYPDAIDGYSQLPLIMDGVTTIDASNINAIRSAIVNIETELGITPSGSFTTLGARLVKIENDIDNLESNSSAPGVEVSDATVNGLIRTTTTAGDTLKGSNIIVSATDGLTVPGDIVANGANTFSGASTFGSTAGFSGATTFSSTAGFTGAATFNGASTFNTDVSVSLEDAESLTVSGGTTSLHGQRHYGSLSSAPGGTLPSPSNGDRYFDTTLLSEMYYDSIGTVWLSVETYSFAFGRNASVPVGGYFRSSDGKAMSSTVGEVARYNGTVVGMTISRDPAPSGSWVTSYAIIADGTGLGSHDITGTATFGNFITRLPFNQDQVLSVGVDEASTHEADGGTTGKVYYKWRA